MTSSSAHWALSAIQELGHRAAPSSATAPLALSAASTFLVRRSALCATTDQAAAAQPLLLVQRPGKGIAGIALQSHTHPFIALDALSRSPRKRLLQTYMMKRGFRQQPSAEEAASSRFLLLHANHLVANTLGANHAMPLYAHSLADLVRLRAHEFKTLEPSQCLVSHHFVEWENWREVVAEPGWELHVGDEQLALAVLTGALRPAEIPFVTEKANIHPAKASSTW